MGVTDSKISFKQSIVRIGGEVNIPVNDAIWQQMFALPESFGDVASLCSVSDIGCLTKSNDNNRPPPNTQVEPNKNLETLLYALIRHLKTLQEQHVYEDDQRRTNNEILNCMRILTRVLPFIYEAQHLKDWHNSFFWEPRRPTCYWDKRRETGPLMDGLNPSEKYEKSFGDMHVGKPLGQETLEIVTSYLFFSGFTLPKRVNDKGKPDLEIVAKVWQTGIGSKVSANCTKDNEKNQQEVIRLLIALMSKTMYIQPNDVPLVDVKALTFMTTGLSERMVKAIVCSTMNTALKYNPNIWSVPVEVATGGDHKKHLVTNCLQLLLALLIYPPPDGAKNQFRQLAGRLKKPEDFQFVNQGLNQVLSQPIHNNFSYSLAKDKAVAWAPEMITLLWELVQCNKNFRRYLVETNSMLDYVVVILYYCLDAMTDAAKHGILRAGVFFLQTMSTEPGFAIKMNEVFRHPETLPPVMRIPNFHGSYTDFLICSFHTIFVSCEGKFEAIYPALLTVLRNIAPYQRNLARATSTKMQDMFQRMCSAQWLVNKENTDVLIIEYLDAVNSILGNNYQENRKFVEVLVASRSRFKALRAFTLDSALDQLNRDAQHRKDRGEDVSAMRSPISRTTSLDSVRGPPSARAPAPSLGDVQEHETFSIGDDDDDDETPIPQSDTVNRASAEDASSPRLSERARGKQPAVSVASTSRTPSTTSLPSLSTSRSPNVSQLQPSKEWLDSWLPQVQAKLEPILHIIDLAEKKQLKFKEYGSKSAATTPAATDVPSTPTKQSLEERRKATEPSELASKPGEEEDSHQADGEGGFQAERDSPPTTTRPPTGFQWTAVAIGWYTALIWSRIYLSEAEAFQGPGGLYSSTDVRLFSRRSAAQEISLRSPRGAIDAVGDGLVKRISSMSLPTGAK
ncbi:uncharacterized protein CLAFUR5_07371 [Fulvia fulva]|uniref:Uncharacterized protein n=1 Tax=Passalora fulva TaxID=5499 RepID=A0A9Q8PAE0_PASFU|nr:uncharacterized protein CLAFUR5_07371 [Fulvia fulva]KAK4623046.1 hypothetical protein CLAFUR0_07244 [Fulvia fulva]UJO18812.1 hypothetical protein CLAFUR5_07371 [Fulvia fulva]WPV30620.1 hypothetical protein CLAFUW7_07240 [Fulvia fulva]